LTFIEYTNTVLQAINEVPLTSAQFGAARGLQQFAKDAVLRSYLDIMGEQKWPWQLGNDLPGTTDTLQREGTRSLVVSERWNDILVDNPYKDAVDWSAIYYVANDEQETRLTLPFLTWEEYEDFYDYVETRNPQYPSYIVQSADGRKMGLAPYSEDMNGSTINYRVWWRPTLYTESTDDINIPDIHYPVLVDGALHHLWSFRGDNEQAQIAYARYEKGIKKMKIKYGNQTKRLRWI